MSTRLTRFLRSLQIGFLAGFVLLSAGCMRKAPPKKPEIAYIKGGGAPLRNRLGPSSDKVATLHGGEKVEVVGKHMRWVQVRLRSGRTGWVHSRFLASPELFDSFRKLAGDAAALPSQGKAVIRREANLHFHAGGNSETFYRLQEGESVDVLRHRLAERVEPSPRIAEAERGHGSARVKVEKLEDWFLVRASDARAGWLRESYFDMNPPIEVARYNEGLRIRAWFVLFKEHDHGAVHPWYLWATIHRRAGLPFDFDGIRVFVWNPRKSRYETSYRRRRLIGFYPIHVSPGDQASGKAPSFSLQLEDSTGKRFVKRYKMVGRLVRSQS